MEMRGIEEDNREMRGEFMGSRGGGKCEYGFTEFDLVIQLSG